MKIFFQYQTDTFDFHFFKKKKTKKKKNFFSLPTTFLAIMKIPTTHFFILLILLYFVGVVTSSMGDRASDFQSRVKICKEECIQDPTKQPSLYLRTLLWDCLDNCKYIVMREITVERRELGLEVYQYHGCFLLYFFLIFTWYFVKKANC